VYAASLNPVDYKIVEGAFRAVMKKKFPSVVGYDFSGIIIDVGSNVGNLKIGMRVAGEMPLLPRFGTCAQYIPVPAANAVEVPDNCPLFESSALPLAGSTSYQAFFDKGNFQKGNKVLILGGNTATGLFGIQIAKALGASKVVATASSREEELKKLGCDQVINYKNQKWHEVLKGENFDIIYDTVGGYASWQNAPLVLKKNGSFVTIVGDREHGSNGGLKSLLSSGLSIINRKFWSNFSNPNYSLFTMTPMYGLKHLFQLYSEKKITIPIDSASTSDITESNVVALFDKLMTYQTKGKIVIQFAKENDANKNSNDDKKENNEIPNNDNNNNNNNNNNIVEENIDNTNKTNENTNLDTNIDNNNNNTQSQ